MNPNTFSIFKLNGTTGLENRNGGDQEHAFDTFNIMSEETFMARLIRIYYLSTRHQKEYRSMLRFAWDEKYDKGNPNKHLIKIHDSIQNSTALVIIGYSFPFFNRDADRVILQSFMERSIYIQDTDPDRIERSIKSVLNPVPPNKLFIEKIKVDQIKPDDKSKPEQFFLPPEL